MAGTEPMIRAKDITQKSDRTLSWKKPAVTVIDKNRKRYAAAGFTVEAALVMPVVLFCVVSMIIYGFELHDIVVCNSAANEAAELMSHMSDAQGRDGIEEYINRKTGKLQAGEYKISVDEYKDGSRVSVFSDRGDREYEDEGMIPEKFMRKLTVLEMIFNEE